MASTRTVGLVRDKGSLERVLAYALAISPPLAFILALWLAVRRRGRLRGILGDRWTLAVIGLLAVLGTLSALRAPVRAFAVAGLASMACLFGFWMVGRFLVESPRRFVADLEKAIALLAVGALLVAWARLSYTLEVGSVSLRVLGPENKGTVMGLGGNGLGPLLVFGGIVALGNAFQRQRPSERLAWLLMAAAMLVAPLALGVRNALWGTLAGTLILLPVAGLVPLAIVVGVTAIAFLAEPALLQRFMRLVDLTSERARWEVWQSAIAMIRDHPWLGVGPNHFGTVHPAYAGPHSGHLRDPHNVYLRVAAEWGVPAALALFSWLLSWPIRLWAARSDHWRWPLAAGFVAFLAMSMFDTPIFTFHISAPVMVGLGLAAARAQDNVTNHES